MRGDNRVSFPPYFTPFWRLMEFRPVPLGYIPCVLDFAFLPFFFSF